MMDSQERAATEAFHAHLLDEFDTNARCMWQARELADIDRYNECVERTRVLYREIKEVEHVLVTGDLPVEGSSPF